MDKEHKKLLNSVRAICEALELMGEDVTRRVAKSENRVLSYLDGRLSRELRALSAVQTEILAKLDRQDKALERILDRLPEADEMEGLRRRIRYLERALQDHLSIQDEESYDSPGFEADFDPPEAYEDEVEATRREESARPPREEPPRPARPQPVRYEHFDPPRHEHVDSVRRDRPDR